MKREFRAERNGAAGVPSRLGAHPRVLDDRVAPLVEADALGQELGAHAGAVTGDGVDSRFPEGHPLERVSTGLLRTRIGLRPLGRQMLAVAGRLAE